VAALTTIYQRLLKRFGPQYWWPAQSPFEMMVGAILTQATNWRNVERAVDGLRRAGALKPQALLALRGDRLERLVHPTGYFRQKATRLRVFTRWFMSRFGGNPARMFREPHEGLRRELLAVDGVGQETADSILLYAGAKPVFVVDAYTMRVLRRHRLSGARATYEQVQRFITDALPQDPALYNEFHALLVAVGKHFCHRRSPDCTRCPLGELPHTSR